MKSYGAENKLQERVRASEIVTGMEKGITMYLVSNPTSIVHSPTCRSCGQSDLGWGHWGALQGRRQDGRAQSYFRLKANIHGDLELRHENCLDFGPPYAKCGFQKKDPPHIWKPINQKSSRHFCAWDLFICEEHIILLNYGLWGDGIEQRKKHELGGRATWVWIMALPSASRGALAWWASVSLYTNGE